MTSSNRDDVLFQTFPLTGEKEISTGTVPIPYQVYDGHGMLIGGTIALDAANAALADESLLPLQTQSGRGLMGIWICDFSDASLGPHHELQFSIFASREPSAPVNDHPFGMLETLVEDAHARMVCHGLWNNTETAVAYNRELLFLPAALSTGEISRQNGRKNAVLSTADNQPLIQANITESKRTAVRTGIDLIRLFGVQRSLKITAAPYVASVVINPISAVCAQNLEARAYIASDTPVLQKFDTKKDQLKIDADPYHNYGFEPLFIEHFTPFRFVYLMPEQPPT